MSRTFWSLHLSFCLPGNQKYEDFVEALFHAFRIVSTHKKRRQTISSINCSPFQRSNWSSTHDLSGTLLASPYADPEENVLFSGQRRLGRYSRHMLQHTQQNGRSAFGLTTVAVRELHNGCFPFWKAGCSIRCGPKLRDQEHIERSLYDWWKSKGKPPTTNSIHISDFTDLE